MLAGPAVARPAAPARARVKRFTEEEIRQRVDEVSSADAIMLLRSLVDLIYGVEADADQGADTLGALYELLDHYNLTP